MTSTSNVIDDCADWMKMDDQVGDLTLKWSNLEEDLMRNFGWSGLSQTERLQVPGAADLEKIQTQLEVLDGRKEQSFDAMVATPVQSLKDVISKLTVVERLLDGEGGPMHEIVSEAVGWLVAHSRVGEAP